LFVGRGHELDGIKRKVEAGLGGFLITQPVVNIWGGPGIGKSWLLAHLQEEYRFDPRQKTNQRTEKDKTFSVLVDFRKSPFTLWEPSSITGVFGGIADQIKGQLGDAAGRVNRQFEAFEAALADFRASSKIYEDIADMAEQLAGLIDHLGSTLVPVLLFDAVERLGMDHWLWLESHLIEPIVRNDQAIMILASRREIPRWLEFSVRQRKDEWELREFGRQETRRQLELAKLGCGHISDLVHFLSSGHPYANELLAQRLQPLAPGQQAHRGEAADIFGEIEDRLLSEVKSDWMKEALRDLSPLRQFNLESMRELLDPKKYGTLEFTDAYLHRMLCKLTDNTNLVWWDKERRGYVVAPGLRRIMDTRNRLKNPEEYYRRHQQASELYASWMKYRSAGHKVLPEALYQLACATTDQADPERWQAIDGLLGQFLTEDYFSREEADALFVRVYRDEDLRDPNGVMPMELYARLLDRLRVFRDQITEEEKIVHPTVDL
jgi:hypothetical protein